MEGHWIDYSDYENRVIVYGKISQVYKELGDFGMADKFYAKIDEQRIDCGSAPDRDDEFIGFKISRYGKLAEECLERGDLDKAMEYH